MIENNAQILKDIIRKASELNYKDEPKVSVTVECGSYTKGMPMEEYEPDVTGDLELTGIEITPRGDFLEVKFEAIDNETVRAFKELLEDCDEANKDMIGTDAATIMNLIFSSDEVNGILICSNPVMWNFNGAGRQIEFKLVFDLRLCVAEDLSDLEAEEPLFTEEVEDIAFEEDEDGQLPTT